MLGENGTQSGNTKRERGGREKDCAGDGERVKTLPPREGNWHKSKLDLCLLDEKEEARK